MTRKLRLVDATGPAMPPGKRNIDIVEDVTIRGVTREETIGTIQWSNPHGHLESNTNVGEYLFVSHGIFNANELLGIVSLMCRLEAKTSQATRSKGNEKIQGTPANTDRQIPRS